MRGRLDCFASHGDVGYPGDGDDRPLPVNGAPADQPESPQQLHPLLILLIPLIHQLHRTVHAAGRLAGRSWLSVCDRVSGNPSPGWPWPLAWVCSFSRPSLGCLALIPMTDIRLVMSAGIATVQLMGLFLGIWTVSQHIHRELAGRTALTLFAKPVGRHHFLIGNTLGSLLVAIIPCGILAALHLGIVVSIDTWGFDFYQDRQTIHQIVDEGTVMYGRLLLAYGLSLTGVMCLTSLAARRYRCISTWSLIVAAVSQRLSLAHLSIDSWLPGWVLLPPLPLMTIDQALQFPELPLSISYIVLCLGAGLLYSIGLLMCSLALFFRRDI